MKVCTGHSHRQATSGCHSFVTIMLRTLTLTCEYE